MASSPAGDGSASLDVGDASSLSSPLPVVTVEEIDAPHIASLVEQYHGPWRKKRGVAFDAAQRGSGYTPVRRLLGTARSSRNTARSESAFPFLT